MFLDELNIILFKIFLHVNHLIIWIFGDNKFTPAFWILENVSEIVEARKNSEVRIMIIQLENL